MSAPFYSQAALVAAGAALGALLRWQLGLRLNPLFAQFAFGTWLANMAGCLLAGAVLGLLLAGKPLAAPLQNMLSVGFLGSLTTFSAFSAEVSERLLHKNWLPAGLILVLHTVCGIAATLLAAAAVRWLIRH
ncbi:CrcB family protein [Eikenella sp. S3360]|uniref:Fluoride-specific ion channel FluC n=1 Tax=Eikenella glucosivorans TaxID=2766967 RepID=A0ABS0NDC8_9NEIS|nr:CrcB family protein [Eikenella glucosivorans]MBH5330259.1 CrcB family protein [Eikenella glucosivorans]